jgi:hypothetical protein
MSHLSPARGRTPAKVTRLAAAVRHAWQDARYADRRLMELRTQLSRHSG